MVPLNSNLKRTPRANLKIFSGVLPDVLDCIADLSSEEVFTPPDIANIILDQFPEEVWEDPSIKILDPVCKTGIFLREAVKRFFKGLEKTIPDPEDRLAYILTQQVCGIALTELTALVSRRSVYCSITANQGNALLKDKNIFKNPEGNVIYVNYEHDFDESIPVEEQNCKICGMSKRLVEDLMEYENENHAYPFTHLTEEELEEMKGRFDIIIGNPPYQMRVGDGSRPLAASIYPDFVYQAIKLNPKQMSMIIPARWFTAGHRNVEKFREFMLSDPHIKTITMIEDASTVFPGVDLKGGVCYFLRDTGWDNTKDGCIIKIGDVVQEESAEGVVSSVVKILSESTLDRSSENNTHVICHDLDRSIMTKVLSQKEPSFASLVSRRMPFGMQTNFSEYTDTPSKNSVLLLTRGGKWKYVSPEYITKNKKRVKEKKLYTPKASGGTSAGGVMSKPIMKIGESCCTETYLIIGDPERNFKAKELKSIASYMSTQFFHFMVRLLKTTQHATQKVYQYVPVQTWNRIWTDEELFAKYELTPEEIERIKTKVRPVDWSDLYSDFDKCE